MRLFPLLILVVLFVVFAGRGAEKESVSEAEKAAKALRNAGPEPKEPLGYLFNPGETPVFAWQDGGLIDTFGELKIEEVAWFDAEGKRSGKPDHGGRWVAFVRSRLPDGRTVMRSSTFFARPEGFFLLLPEALGMRLEATDDAASTPLATHRDEVRRLVRRPLLEAINGGDPRGARLAAALHDARQKDADQRLRYGVEERARHCELKARMAYSAMPSASERPDRSRQLGRCRECLVRPFRHQRHRHAATG